MLWIFIEQLPLDVPGALAQCDYSFTGVARQQMESYLFPTVPARNRRFVGYNPRGCRETNVIKKMKQINNIDSEVTVREKGSSTVKILTYEI